MAHLHAGEPRPIVQLAGEGLRLFPKLLEIVEAAGRDSRGPELEVGIELEPEIRSVAEVIERLDGRLVEGRAARETGLGERLLAGVIEVARGPIPHLPAQRVMGEQLDLLRDAVGELRFQHAKGAAVQRPATLTQEALIRHFQRQGMLERVFELGEETRFVKELGGLQLGETAAHVVRRLVRNGLQQRDGNILADDGGGLQQVLDSRRQPVNPRSEDGLDGRRYLCRLHRCRETVGASFADEDAHLDQRSHALFQEEGVPVCALDQQPLEGSERQGVPEQRFEELLRAVRREGLDPELRVVALAPPPVAIFGPVVDEQDDAGCRQALNKTVQERLSLGVDPVQILEHQEQRLDLALAEQQALDGVEGSLAAVGGAQLAPLRRVVCDVEEPEERWKERPQRLVQGQELSRNLLADRPRSITLVDLEVRPQQLNDRKIGRRLAVRDGEAFEDGPARRVG